MVLWKYKKIYNMYIKIGDIKKVSNNFFRPNMNLNSNIVIPFNSSLRAKSNGIKFYNFRPLTKK